MGEINGIYFTSHVPYHKYVVGPVHITLKYSSLNGVVRGSYIEFLVYDFNNMTYVKNIPSILMDDEFK